MSRIREGLIHAGAFLLGYYVAALLSIALPDRMSSPSFDKTGLVLYFIDAIPQFVGWTLAAYLASRFTQTRSPWPGSIALAALFAISYFGWLRFGPSMGLFDRVAPVLPIILALALAVYVYRWAHAHRVVKPVSA
jgi:putative Mn2+ efflux pump MntP